MILRFMGFALLGACAPIPPALEPPRLYLTAEQIEWEIRIDRSQEHDRQRCLLRMGDGRHFVFRVSPDVACKLHEGAYR